jgi:hypothetical protein
MERIERRDFPESKGSNSVRGYFLWMAGTLCVWAPVYYVLFHLLIGIPIRLLYVPAAVHFIVLLSIAVIAVHAYTRFESRDAGILYVVATIYMFCSALCLTGIRIGVIPRDHEICSYRNGCGSTWSPHKEREGVPPV